MTTRLITPSLDTPNPSRQRPCCRNILRDNPLQPATTTSLSHRRLSSSNHTLAHLAISLPPWAPLRNATTTIPRLSSRRNNISDTAVDTAHLPLLPAALLLRAKPSPRPHHRQTMVRALDLRVTTTVLRFLKLNVRLLLRRRKTLTLTVVRHYGRYLWPSTRSAMVS